LGLALEEPDEQDTVIKENGFNFALSPSDKRLLEPYGSIYIDYFSHRVWGGYIVKARGANGTCGC